MSPTDRQTPPWAARTNVKMRCPRCQETKPEANFGFDKSVKGGRRKTCKSCDTARRIKANQLVPR